MIYVHIYIVDHVGVELQVIKLVRNRARVMDDRDTASDRTCTKSSIVVDKHTGSKSLVVDKHTGSS